MPQRNPPQSLKDLLAVAAYIHDSTPQNVKALHDVLKRYSSVSEIKHSGTLHRGGFFSERMFNQLLKNGEVSLKEKPLYSFSEKASVANHFMEMGNRFLQRNNKVVVYSIQVKASGFSTFKLHRYLMKKALSDVAKDLGSGKIVEKNLYKSKINEDLLAVKYGKKYSAYEVSLGDTLGNNYEKEIVVMPGDKGIKVTPKDFNSVNVMGLNLDTTKVSTKLNGTKFAVFNKATKASDFYFNTYDKDDDEEFFRGKTKDGKEIELEKLPTQIKPTGHVKQHTLRDAAKRAPKETKKSTGKKDWWDFMSYEEQKNYLKAYPNSKKKITKSAGSKS